MWRDRLSALVRSHPRLVLLFLAAVLLLPTLWTLGRTAGGGRQEETSGPPPGAAVYYRMGCALCHGMRAEGTSGAPPLRGVPAEVLLRFVRVPLEAMPAYPPDLLTEEDLALLAEALGGLEPGEPPSRLPRARLRQEAVLALAALVRGDGGRARRGLLPLASHPAAGPKAREALRALREGRAGDALPLAEGAVLALDPRLDLSRLYTRLAGQAALVGRQEEAVRVLTRALAFAGPLSREEVSALLEAARRGDLTPLLEDLF